jgi:hypothetical protein
MGNETTTTQETQFVFRRLEEALRLFGRETDPHWFWVFVLVVVLIAGFFYVGWMYRRDSRSVGRGWASFLASLRCLVYAILAAVFLLPALQTWDRTEFHSKVIVLHDVSGSTENRDDPPTESQPPDKLPTRQDKVIRFLTDDHVNFLPRLEETNPVTFYRFGKRLDENFQTFDGGKTLSASEWADWLKPNPKQPIPDGLSDEERTEFQKRLDLNAQLVSGTNLVDSLQAVFNRESGNMLQAIIVFSDGRSTEFSREVLDELRPQLQRAKVPIFTVAVGEYRLPINIRITDLQVPEQARPDDKFPVRVEVDGEGLPDRESVVTLDVTGPKGDKHSFDKPFKFSAGAGGPPHAQIEFEIDAAQLGVAAEPGKKPKLEEGEWTLQARIPRERREVFLDKEHKSGREKVRIIKKPLRVLLFAGAATHDYQFLRSMLVREVDEHRAELSVYLQMQREGVVQDVTPDRFLKGFPSRLGDESAGSPDDRYYNLSQYDLIIAFDPDWGQLEATQLAQLERWVSQHAGGLILVAGPVNTYQLTRTGDRDKIKPILNLFPVLLQNSYIQDLSKERSTNEPWKLNFPGATAEMEFLKLDEAASDPLGGWSEFFTGLPKAEVTRETPTIRGFYSYYPVEAAKPGAIVVATYADPRARLRDSNKEQPYLVTMPYGSGRVVYIGSGETWRLRQYREVFHERFWTKLARYAGSGNLTRLARHGVLVMGREFSQGQYIGVEAQLFGRDLQPLSRDSKPLAQVEAPRNAPTPMPVVFQAKPGNTEGWFQARFRIPAPGEYRLNLQVPDSGESSSRKFIVKESNPELDDTRPDFGALYQLASEATDHLPQDRQTQDELKQALEGTAARLLRQVNEQATDKGQRGAVNIGNEKQATEKLSTGAALHFFFDLNSAHLIPKCVTTQSRVQRSRGPIRDLWDEGFSISSDHSVQMATVLLLVAGLLSIEWLTRKLLKLA